MSLGSGGDVDRCPLCFCPALEHPQDSSSTQRGRGPPAGRGRGRHSDKQLGGVRRCGFSIPLSSPGERALLVPVSPAVTAWGTARATRTPLPSMLSTREILQQLLPAMAGGGAQPGLLLPSPPRVPQQDACRWQRGQCESRWFAQSLDVTAAAEAACPGLPGEGLWCGKSLQLHRLQPFFGMAEDWTPPVRSSPCSEVPGVPQEGAVGPPKVSHSHCPHVPVRSSAALRAAEPGWAVSPRPRAGPSACSHPCAAGVLRDASSQTPISNQTEPCTPQCRTTAPSGPRDWGTTTPSTPLARDYTSQYALGVWTTPPSIPS